MGAILGSWTCENLSYSFPPGGAGGGGSQAAGGGPAPWGKKLLESSRLGSHSTSASPAAALCLPPTHTPAPPGTASTAEGQGDWLLSALPSSSLESPFLPGIDSPAPLGEDS